MQSERVAVGIKARIAGAPGQAETLPRLVSAKTATRGRRARPFMQDAGVPLARTERRA